MTSVYFPESLLSVSDRCTTPSVSAILNLGRSPGALRAHIPPAGVYSGLRRPVLSLRDQGAAPPLRLGVLALPGDGGHLTDFVANLWSIGALVTLYNIGEAQTMVLLTPGGPRCLSPQ